MRPSGLCHRAPARVTQILVPRRQPGRLIDRVGDISRRNIPEYEVVDRDRAVDAQSPRIQRECARPLDVVGYVERPAREGVGAGTVDRQVSGET